MTALEQAFEFMETQQRRVHVAGARGGASAISDPRDEDEVDVGGTDSDDSDGEGLTGRRATAGDVDTDTATATATASADGGAAVDSDLSDTEFETFGPELSDDSEDSDSDSQGSQGSQGSSHPHVDDQATTTAARATTSLAVAPAVVQGPQTPIVPATTVEPPLQRAAGFGAKARASVLVVTTEAADDLDAQLRSLFTHEVRNFLSKR